MGKIFIKGLNEDDKKGLFKRQKNIEDKNEKQLEAIEDKKEKQLDKNSKSLKSIRYFSQLSTKAKELFEKIKKEKNDIDPEKSVCVKTDDTVFNFNKFKNSLDLAANIYRDNSLLKNAEDKQNEIKVLLNKLRKCISENPKKIKVKEKTLNAAEKLLNKRQEVTDAIKTGIFPYIDGFQIKQESEEEPEEQSEEESEEKRSKKFINTLRKNQKA